MNAGHKASISRASSYQEIGAYWDEHQPDHLWDPPRRVAFDVEIESRVRYFALDRDLCRKLDAAARQRGTTAETLLNQWVEEKLRQS